MLERSKSWQIDNKNHIKRTSFEWNLKKKYGIDGHDWSNMFNDQNGLCALCGSGLDGQGNTHVDHCHLTSRVRSLLCGWCNKMIGFSGDNVDMLKKAINYLQSH